MKYKGIRISSSFALTPNLKSMCGSPTAPPALVMCAQGGDCELAKAEFPSFRTMWPYLRFIAEIMKCDAFDDLPAEIYWLGNPAVFTFKPMHFEILLGYFAQSPQIPETYIEELRQKPPKVFFPFHTFQVLLSAVHHGGINAFTLPGIIDCMVTWGIIKSVKGDNAHVCVTHLVLKNGLLELGESETVLPLNSAITPNLKKGDYVAIHWGTIVLKINVFAANRLNETTKRILQYQSNI